jgi:hypothetical protein
VTDPPPRSQPIIVLKDEVELRALPPELEVHVWDYHADPIHVSLEDLLPLGLTATEPRSHLGPSRVSPWRRALRQGKGRDAPLPHLGEEAHARAVHLGGLALVPVAEGVDMYVISYHASSVLLGPSHLARLGLHYREA